MKLSKENCPRWKTYVHSHRMERTVSLNPKTLLSLGSCKTPLRYGLMAAADKLWDLVLPFPQAALPILGPTASPRENNAFLQTWSKLIWLKKRRCIQRSLHAFQICSKFPISNSIHLSLVIELCAFFTDKWEWNVNSSQMSKIYRLSHWGSAASIYIKQQPMNGWKSRYFCFVETLIPVWYRNVITTGPARFVHKVQDFISSAPV